jgi:hypothetical protein
MKRWVLKSLKQNGFQEKSTQSQNFLQIAHHITNELSFNNKAESRFCFIIEGKTDFKI